MSKNLKGQQDEVKTYLMFDGKRYKIGKSKNVLKRFSTLKVGSPDLTFIGYTDKFSEEELHLKYKNNRYKGEWFEFNYIELIEVLEDFSEFIDEYKIKYYKRYNIVNGVPTNATGYNLKNYKRFLSKTGKYKVGNYSFATKDALTKFNRSLLDDLEINKTIFEGDIYDFATDLFSHHPNKHKCEGKNIVALNVVYDSVEDKYKNNSKQYSNFNWVFDDGTEWNFSSKKCITEVKPESKERRKLKNVFFDSSFTLMFGKHKGQAIDEVLLKDKDYFKWCYQNISDFKYYIDRSKYKTVFKVNL